MTRSAMLRSQGGSKAGGPAPAQGSDPPPGTAARDLPPDATLPATPAQMLALGDHETARVDAPPPPLSAAPAASGRKAGAPKRPPAPASPAPAAASPAPAAASPAPAAAPSQETLDLVLRELRSLRELQERILDLLARTPAAGSAASGDGATDDGEAEVSPIRVRRRKSVVLVDDDPATREAAVTEMMQADIPVRAFPDGNAAVSAIADEKPDVIVLELALAGAMEGRDVINMIKATMEWVDIPIVLWTRAPVQNQREARQVHGADEIVQKSSGAAALVARVITLFRRVH